MSNCDACMEPSSVMRSTDAGQMVCLDCFALTFRVERDAARRRLKEAVETLERIVVCCDNGSDATSKMEFIRRVAVAAASPRKDETDA